MRTAIPLPALLSVFLADRFFLAVADRLHAIGADAQRFQELLGRVGAPLSKAQVVLGRAALVAIALKFDLYLSIRAQVLGGFRQRIARVATNVGLVQIKIDIVNVLVERAF